MNLPRLSDASPHLVRIQYDRNFVPSHITRDGFTSSPANFDHMKWGTGEHENA
jgi:hypothetical protein